MSSNKLNLTETKNKNINTILIAEDEEYNFLFLEEILNKEGYKIIHSKDGKETIEICKSNPNIGLILMDIKMPIIDGIDAYLAIKDMGY